MKSKGMDGARRSTGGRRAHRFGRGEGGQALTEGAVADLIVILEKAHEARGGKPRARLAPRPAAIGRPLALIGESPR
jgi:hypothetical protein